MAEGEGTILAILAVKRQLSLIRWNFNITLIQNYIFILTKKWDKGMNLLRRIATSTVVMEQKTAWKNTKGLPSYGWGGRHNSSHFGRETSVETN